jgi:hypothetical protein
MAAKKRSRARRTTKTLIVLVHPDEVEPDAFGAAIADFVAREIAARDETTAEKEGAKK